MKPSAPVLEAMAQSLGHPPSYFTEQAPIALNGAVFRRQAGLGARERTRIEVAVLEQVERHLLLEELLALDREAASMPVSQQQPGTGISSSGDELGEALADRLRSTWDLGGEPITNLTRVLERHGIEILLLELPEGIAGVACQVRRFDRPAVPCIVVDPVTDVRAGGWPLPANWRSSCSSRALPSIAMLSSSGSRPPCCFLPRICALRSGCIAVLSVQANWTGSPAFMGSAPPWCCCAANSSAFWHHPHPVSGSGRPCRPI